MRIIIISDIHLGCGLDDLDMIKISRLDEIFAQHKGVKIILAGDVFDRRQPSKKVRLAFMELLLKHSKSLDGNLIHIVGNHDQHEHRLSPLSEFIFGTRFSADGLMEITTAEGIQHLGKDVVLAPWQPVLDPKLKNQGRFLISHVNIVDWHRGNNGIKIEEIGSLGYELVICGDIHEQHEETIGGTKVMSVGCFPSSFRDLDLKASYIELVFDNVGYEVERRWVDFPVFRKLTVSSPDEKLEVTPGDFVRVNMQGGVDFLTAENKIAIQNQLIGAGANIDNIVDIHIQELQPVEESQFFDTAKSWAAHYSNKWDNQEAAKYFLEKL